MNIFKWSESIIQKMKWYDMSLTKLSSLAFGLFLAKLWPDLLALEWYCYLGGSLILAIIPLRLMFTKDK